MVYERRILLRPVRLDDLNELYIIDKICFPEHYFPKDFLRYLLTHDSALSFAATMLGKIVGFVIGVAEGEIGRIYTLDVVPEFRRRGVGAMLLKKVEEELRRKGVRIYCLEVMRENYPAIKLYLKMNYKPVRILKGYYGNRDGILMVKEAD